MAWRNIRHNKACQSPRSLLFFDCETSSRQIDVKKTAKQHRLKLGFASYFRVENGKQTRRRECPFEFNSEFWQFVAECTDDKRTLWAFAHNILFDLRCVDFDLAITSGEWILSAKGKPRTVKVNGKEETKSNGLCVIDGQPFILCLENRSTGGRVIFVDTLNYFQCTLKKLGESAGVQKHAIDFDSCSDADLAEYCKNDVAIIETAMAELIQWSEENDLGNFRYTIPGNAMNAFRHRFMRHKITLHDDEKVKKLERESYFGGQTECYTVGRLSEQLYLVDVRSLYPSVMRHNEFPVCLDRFGIGSELNQIPAEDELAYMIAEVRIKSDCQTYPIRRTGKLDYVLGDFWTSLAGPELVKASKLGHIADIGKWSTYRMAPIFTEYVEFFWSKRREYEINERPLYASLCKMYLNSLYGKFGALTPNWKDRHDLDCDDRWSTWLQSSIASNETTKFRSIDDLVQEEIERTDNSNSFAAIASFVCSYGRVRMERLREIAVFSNVHYQGVDSLIVNSDGFAKLIEAGEIKENIMGKLHLKDSAMSAELRGKYQYKFGDKVVISGLRDTAIHLDGNTYEQLAFDGVASLFSPSPSIGPVESRRRITLSHQYECDVSGGYYSRVPNKVHDSF